MTARPLPTLMCVCTYTVHTRTHSQSIMLFVWLRLPSFRFPFLPSASPSFLPSFLPSSSLFISFPYILPCCLPPVSFLPSCPSNAFSFSLLLLLLSSSFLFPSYSPSFLLPFLTLIPLPLLPLQPMPPPFPPLPSSNDWRLASQRINWIIIDMYFLRINSSPLPDAPHFA